MNGVAVHGWCHYWWGNSGDEMYGGIHRSSYHPWIFLPSINVRGPPVECIIYISLIEELKYIVKIKIRGEGFIYIDKLD